MMGRILGGKYRNLTRITLKRYKALLKGGLSKKN